MYASIHQFRRSLPHETDGWAKVLASALHEGQQPVASCAVAQLAGPDRQDIHRVLFAELPVLAGKPS